MNGDGEDEEERVLGAACEIRAGFSALSNTQVAGRGGAGRPSQVLLCLAALRGGGWRAQGPESALS